jgi:hypothetical protein
MISFPLEDKSYTLHDRQLQFHGRLLFKKPVEQEYKVFSLEFVTGEIMGARAWIAQG